MPQFISMQHILAMAAGPCQAAAWLHAGSGLECKLDCVKRLASLKAT